MSGLFVAGTSTEVGKTYVAALIARALVASGWRVGVYKPVASGCRREGERLFAEDAEMLWEAAGKPGDLQRVCPQRFELPVAPPQAARAEGPPALIVSYSAPDWSTGASGARSCSSKGPAG